MYQASRLLQTTEAKALLLGAVSMTQAAMQQVPLTDLELAALISSKICHDVIGPVGAICNGLEILDEDDNQEAKTYALDVIRNVTETASAKLQFARFAFGAAGSAGATIDMITAEQISRGFVGQGKHKLVWKGPMGHMPKDRAKLLLNMVASAITALPRGGEIGVEISGALEQPTFKINCRGERARTPQHLAEFMTGQGMPPLDSMTIQAYYTCRLAAPASMRLAIEQAGSDIVLAAYPAG
jgi:histidine phosphotransferase ChpT